MNKTINQYKLKLNEKEKEISELKGKEISLNKKSTILVKKKSVNNSYSVNSEYKSKSIINMFKKEISGLSRKKVRKFPIKIIKRNNISNSFSQSNFYSQNKNKIHNSNNNSLLATNLNDSESNRSNVYSFKKITKSNLNTKKKNNFTFYLNKNIKKNIRDNSRNIIRNNKFIRIYKVQTNITNNNYNIQRNNSLININNVNKEKLKIQQKLEVYLKMIEKKLKNLKNKRENKIELNKQSKTGVKKNSSLDKIIKLKSFLKEKNLNKTSINNYSFFENIDTNITKNSHNKNIIVNLKKKKKK